MMNQQKTKKAGILKYSLIVPLALALVLSSNAETLVSKTKNIISQKTIENTESSSTIKTQIPISSKDTLISEKKEVQTPVENIVKNSKPEQGIISNEKIYTVVENMPKFPGGESELFNFISRNLRYPIDAMQKGIQGKVIVKFVVNTLGEVENAEIIRGINTSLDQAGLKVINSLPNWTPGEQNGKKVAVYYTLPITFKLDESKPDIKANEKTRENFFKSLVIIVDGIQQPIGFDYRSIKKEDIESVNVMKPDTEEKRKELIAKYGENANVGVIEITLKK